MRETTAPEPWERIRGSREPYQKGESTQAFHAFEHYRDLGSARSLVAAYNDHIQRCLGRQTRRRRAAGSWNEWSVAWRWTERAEAWDRHLDLLRRAEIEARERTEAERWVAVRAEVRDREVVLGRTLIAKAEEMLGFPLKTERSEDGKTVVEPGRWSFATAAKLLETASKLMRLAAEMETDRPTVNVAMLRAEARRLADEFGLSEEEALAEVDKILVERKGEM